MDEQTVVENIRALASEFANERGERQLRRDLRRADFDKIRDSGYLLTAVLVDQGRISESVEKATRPICDMLSILAQGGPSIALVSAMHPAVITFGTGCFCPRRQLPIAMPGRNKGVRCSKPLWMVASGAPSCPKAAALATPVGR